MQEAKNIANIGRHPKAVYLLASTQFWERFSYYGILGILALYLTAPAGSGGLDWANGDALKLVGIFSGATFILPLLGGYLADRWLGERRCITIGSLAIIAGHILLGLQAHTDFSTDVRTSLLYSALALIALGTGLLKPAVSSIVAHFYAPGDTRKEEGYMLFMFCIYTGTLLSFVLVGGLSEWVGWSVAFSSASGGMAFGYLVYFFMADRLLGEVGVKPNHSITTTDPAENHSVTWQGGFLMAAFSLLTLIFTMCYFQDSGIFSLYLDNDADRRLLGFEVPAPWFLAVGQIAFMIIIPVLARLWRVLAARGLYADVLMKQAGALFAMTCAYLLLYAGITGAGDAPVSAVWFIVAYTLYGVADALTWPSQLNAVTSLAPVHQRSIYVGGWWVAAGLGIFLTGYVADWEKVLGMHGFVLLLAGLMGTSAIIALLIRPFFRKSLVDAI